MARTRNERKQRESEFWTYVSIAALVFGTIFFCCGFVRALEMAAW